MRVLNPRFVVGGKPRTIIFVKTMASFEKIQLLHNSAAVSTETRWINTMKNANNSSRSNSSFILATHIRDLQLLKPILHTIGTIIFLLRMVNIIHVKKS